MDVKTGVFAYLTAAADTTITTANNWYPINGIFVNDPFENFVVEDQDIVYTGPKRYMEVDGHATVSVDSPVTEFFITVKKNTYVYEDEKMGTLAKSAGEPYAASGTLVLEVDTGDTIQLVCTADGNGDVLTMEHFVVSIRPFFN